MTVITQWPNWSCIPHANENWPTKTKKKKQPNPAIFNHLPNHSHRRPYHSVTVCPFISSSISSSCLHILEARLYPALLFIDCRPYEKNVKLPRPGVYISACVCCRLRVSGAVERPLVSIGDRGASDCERVHDDQQGPLHRDQRRQVPHSGHVSLSLVWIASEI